MTGPLGVNQPTDAEIEAARQSHLDRRAREQEQNRQKRAKKLQQRADDFLTGKSNYNTIPCISCCRCIARAMEIDRGTCTC